MHKFLFATFYTLFQRCYYFFCSTFLLQLSDVLFHVLKHFIDCRKSIKNIFILVKQHTEHMSV